MSDSNHQQMSGRQAEHADLQKRFDELALKHDGLDNDLDALAETFVQEGITMHGAGRLEEELLGRVTRIRKDFEAIERATDRFAEVGIKLTCSRGAVASEVAWDDLPALYRESACVRAVYDALNAAVFVELEQVLPKGVLDQKKPEGPV